jgi:methionyl-tRNA formyltransferase
MICIAGKNQCAVDALRHLISMPNIETTNICICLNKDDNGIDTWQPSLSKFAIQNNVKIKNLEELYDDQDLVFFSLEYDRIIDINKFKSNRLFNFHFSLLPKYRGCHTNYLQLKNGEKYSGVTCHEIDNGIDTGKIIDSIKYRIELNDTSKENYLKLMSKAVELFSNILPKLLSGNYIAKKQAENKATYFTRSYIDYKREIINPPYQLPEINGRKIIKSKLFDDHLILTDINNNEHIYD